MNESITSIIRSAMENNPLETKNAIERAISEKVASGLEQRKIVIAKNLVSVDEGMKHKGKNKNVDEPSEVKKAPWDKKNEEVDIGDLITFMNEEYELDIQDEEELELILEGLSEDELTELLNELDNSITMKSKV